MSATAAVLNAAADYMATHGLEKGTYYGEEHDEKPSCCALGSIHAVEKDARQADLAIQALNDHLGFYVDEFNDDPTTAQDDVVDLFRTVADNLTEKEDGLDN